MATQDRHYDHDEMAARGRLGALCQQARHDVRTTTRAARRAFLARFEHEVDPDEQLPEEERARRAAAARRAYFQRLARKSAQVRATSGKCQSAE